MSDERFAELHFAPAPDVSGPVPGPRSRELLAEQAALEGRARSYPRAVPIALDEGRGATVRDADGNTFIDFFGGAGALNVGHALPQALAAATAQQGRLIHALDFPTVSKTALMRAVKERLPGGLKRTARFHFGGPTGSDAIEAALKLTRHHTGRPTVLAFQGSYHGMTQGALSVTSDTSYAGAGAGAVQFVPYAYCYRCPLGLRRESCGLACAKLVETVLEDPHSGTGPPAAVVVEPIQGEGGTIVPPPGYLTELRRITAKHHVPLVCDEIQTGFGRTGKAFGSDHDGVSPDVVTLSKAIGGIGYPLSCIAYDEALDTWAPGSHIGTFRGHQVAMAAGLAALRYMDETDVVGHAAALGELALATLRAEAATLASIGDVRGRGLMIGVELVRDRDTKEPWPELAASVRRDCVQRGLIVELGGHFGNVVRFLPPLVITRSMLLRGLELFTDSVRELERVPAAGRLAAAR